MKKEDKPVLLWVHPKFKTKLKIKSAELGMPLVNLTKDLGKDGMDLEDYFKNGNKKFKI